MSLLPFSRNSAIDRARTVLVAAATVLLTAATTAATLILPAALGGAAAHAQAMAPPPATPDPPYKPFTVVPASNAAILLSTEKSSPVNPFPFGGGNAQNRAWAADDYLWQMLDDNVPYYRPPVGRAIGSGYIDIDGWQFPRLNDFNETLGAVIPISNPNGLNRPATTPLTVTAFADGEPSATAAPAPENAQSFLPITAAPLASTNIISSPTGNSSNPGYYEGIAFPRPASSALNYDARDKFTWRLDNPPPLVTDPLLRVNIPGNIGVQGRYRIFVHIPTPVVTDPVTNTNYGGIVTPEIRTDDARYTVYYYARAENGAYIPKQQVCTLVAQTDGGDFELLTADGNEAVFPLFSSATFTTKGVPLIPLTPQPTYPTSALTPLVPGTPTAGGIPLIQGVAIDNTTTDSGSIQFVIADSLTLKPGTGTVSATPTITPPHGGSKVVASSALATAIPTQTNEYLPDSPDINYNVATGAPTMPDPNNVFGTSTTAGLPFSYANDINDSTYTGTGYANYTPWDVSTYFQGPRSLIDPRFAGTDANNQVFAAPGAQIGPIDPYLSDRPTLSSPADSANPIVGQDFFRAAFSADATNNTRYPAPYFSHVQVLIAKTEFVQDPENGVSDANKTGVKTTQVGAIYALDWQTGAPVWRFPDRTYLPGGAVLNNTAIPGAGLRNPFIGMDPIAKVPVFTVPGIVAIDVNGDGKISDDEVFLGASQKVLYPAVGGAAYTLTAGANTTGEVNASVTVSPRIPVQGAVQVPVHDLLWNPTTMTTAAGTSPTDITSVANATAGRYYNPVAGSFSPVPVGTAFIAAGNGVLYAVDAYGNNDTRYFDGGTIPATVGGNYVGGTYFGTYQAGTTNLFWTFSATSHSRQQIEGGQRSTALLYNQRVMGEVPATASFGGSAPVLAWNLTDSEIAQTMPPATPELRLFVGNTNGVLYAMDPQSNAGYIYSRDPATGAIVPTGVQTLPFVKGGQSDLTNYYGTAPANNGAPATDPVSNHQSELKWWFRTRGSINFAPAVSLFRHDMSLFQSGTIEKGVYVTSSEGRAYCIDWDGPSDLANNLTHIPLYNGSPGSADVFNNDSFFHNTLPAFNKGLADTEEGHVRPRWTYPNLYRFNLPGTADAIATVQADVAIATTPIEARDFTGSPKLGEPENTGIITTPPVLMDFWWQDPDVQGTPPTLLDYVAFVANDPTSNGAPATASRVYLLDQIGDLKNFLTNPRKTGGAGANARVYAQPRDRYTPNALLASQTDATIPTGLTWSYRFQNDAYAAKNGAPQPQDLNEIQLRNNPLFGTLALGIYDESRSPFDPAALITLTAQQTGQAAGGAGIASAYIHQPGRRMLPTLFAGGIGKVYALDIDPETGLFMRWRPTVGEMAQFTVLPSRMLQGLPLDNQPAYPGDPTTTGTMSVLDQVTPADHIFDAPTNANSAPIPFGYARSVLATQEIFARVASFNGPDGSEVTSLTVSGGGQNRNNFIPENGVAQTFPSVPARPTNDLPNLLPFAIATVTPQTDVNMYATVRGGDGLPIVTVDVNGLPSNPPVSTSLSLGGHVTNAVNQDRNDPVATKAGSIASDPSSTPAANIPNAAMPYPILFCSTLGSYIHGLSTNIEGEDRETAPPTGTGSDSSLNLGIAGNSFSMAWGIAPPGDPAFTNVHTHVDMLDIQGPGGLAGISLFSNAYFPATDPYATAYRSAASNTSLNIDPNDIADEPNTTVATPSGPDGLGGTVTDPDNPNEPRPDFMPRPYVFAQTGNGAGAPTTAADAHTGLSGFPLGLNGHFFDRQYAGAGTAGLTGTGATGFPALRTITGNVNTATPSGIFGYSNIANYNNDGQHPFGDYHVWPRVPGYSNIGTQLGGLIAGIPSRKTATNAKTGAKTNAKTSGLLKTNSAANNLGYSYADINNQTPDGVREFNENGVTGVDTRLPALPVGANPEAGDIISDDINPAAQDVAWFYTGGDNGVVYAYTPAVAYHDTGLQGGNRLVPPDNYLGGVNGSDIGPDDASERGADGSNPQVNIYTQADLNVILGQLTAGANSPVARDVYMGVASSGTWQYQSIAAKGGKNYYEWGETVYILAYDLLAKPFVASRRRFARYIPTIPIVGGFPQGGLDHSVQMTIISTAAGTTVNAPVLSLEGANYLTDGAGKLLQYYLDLATNTYRVYDVNSSPASAIPLGVAVYKYVLGSNPSASNAQTPGDLLSIKVLQTISGYSSASPPQGFGETTAIQARNNPAAYFSIANPLAVQAMLTAVSGNTTVAVNPNLPANGYGVNEVGPFESVADPLATNAPKHQDSTTVDPNINGGQYSQALTNGNTLQRIYRDPYVTQTVGNTTNTIPNNNIGNAINQANGTGAEKPFYFPVAGSAGYVNHGTTGSTTKGTDFSAHYLRLLNRSLLTNGLAKVRVMPSDQPSDLLFRAWPAKVMNADADATVNTPITPAGMDLYGTINYLPWEVKPPAARPWSSATIVNRSPDYPDVQGRKNNAIQVLSGSGDLVAGPGTLPAIVNGQSKSENDGVSVSITMPQYQPANLVAAQELTSTYQVPNPNDFPAGVTIPTSVPAGPLQLPKGVANRLLSYNNQQVVTPFGYTARLVAFIDSDGTGKLAPNSTSNRPSGGTLNQAIKAYREFEVWTGVPVDQSLKVVESVIDLGALSHSFAEQNGLLGYTSGGNTADAIGLTPLNPAYGGYFKTFTVQNPGNVNDYNLRPTQKIEANNNPATQGTGNPFNYFLMRSPTVDPRFGILAVGADPTLGTLSPNANGNLMPQIVTSLDPIFDAVWNGYTKAQLEAQLGTTLGDQTYTNFYAVFGGKHPFHKAKVGSASPSVLGIPDQPTAQTLVPGAQITSVSPEVAMAVPLGTPVGVYSSSLGNSPFTVFEDHDTPNYIPTPFVTSGGMSVSPTISPAGPLYHGQNAAPPNALPVYSGGTSTTGQGVWRPQTVAKGTYGTPSYVPPVFLPYAYPYLTIKATVTENGLTGQFPDLATATSPSINTGVLPSIDPSPKITAATVTNTNNTAATTFYRPSAALTPAAWRDGSGNMHIYYSRNDSASGGAAPGAPYLLYHSSLQWDNGNGVWKAANTGAPIAIPANSAGHWLTTPIALPSSPINAMGTESNTSPYVLTHSATNNSGTTTTIDAATLFFTDSVANPNGSQHNRIFFTDVTSDGVGGAPSEYFLNADPSFARYAPRAAYVEASGNASGIDELMYYGGTAGKWQIYYVPRTAANGLPTGTAPDASVATTPVELQLTMPNAIVSASEPSPMYRSIFVTDASGNTALTSVMDVYFTGISRTTQTPDIYMNRYTIADGTNGTTLGTLSPLALPAVTDESLESIGRSGFWRSKSLSWLTTPTLPTVKAYKGAFATGATAYLTTVAENWRTDPSTGILYQAVQKNGSTSPTTLTYVYADVAAGTVQFRGASSPLATDSVTASYTPQTYRLTSDGASNYGNFSFTDPQTLPATPTGNASVLRRATPILSGRNYLLWQKGALAGKSPTLYYAVRRVGVDLNIPANQSILLGKASASGDQQPAVGPVTVNGNSVPFDVDFINGRVYVEPKYDGQPIVVNYMLVQKGSQGTAGYAPVSMTTPTTPPTYAQYLDELNVGAQGNFGAALPITAGINEGQVASLIDLYNWSGSRNDPPSVSTSGATDPALTPGRVWVFWTSPRGRTGQTNVSSPSTPDPYPSGFNLYWETIAPNFDGSAIYSSTSTSGQ